MTHLLAEGGYQIFSLHSTEKTWLYFALLCAVASIAVALLLVRGVLAADQGTASMKEIAKAIQGIILIAAVLVSAKKMPMRGFSCQKHQCGLSASPIGMGRENIDLRRGDLKPPSDSIVNVMKPADKPMNTAARNRATECLFRGCLRYR